MKVYLLIAGLAGVVPVNDGQLDVGFPYVKEGGARHFTALGFFEDVLVDPETCSGVENYYEETKVDGRDVCWIDLRNRELQLGEPQQDPSELDPSRFVDLRELFPTGSPLARVARSCLSGEPRCEALQARLNVAYCEARYCDISGLSMGGFFPLRYEYIDPDYRRLSRPLAAGLELELRYAEWPIEVTINDISGCRTPIVFKLGRDDDDEIELIVNNFPQGTLSIMDSKMVEMHSRAILDLTHGCVYDDPDCPRKWSDRHYGVGALSIGERAECKSSFSGNPRLTQLLFPSRVPFPFNLLEYSYRFMVMNDQHETPVTLGATLFGPPICPKVVLSPPTE